uniref:VWF/SSPO/Zonadhesin-like cysteine-rich domain-containing protein n=1 Tax=Plectus sambesii TaxID=2011161 RepID=A0A914XTI5_9BILA
MNNLFGIPTGNCIWPTEGPIAMVAEKFGDDWIDDFENGACIPGSIFKNSSLPCSPDEYMAAKKMCQAIEEAKSGKGIFAKCVSLGAQLDELFNGCSYDVCADPALRCAALTAFVHTCQKAIPGTRLSGWRESLSCPLVCPANQSYSECVSGCQPTCANTTTKAVCDKPCIEGCVCSYGTVLDGTGLNCIPQEHCGCIDKTNGNYYEAGSIWMNADCTKTYKCLEFGNMIDKDVTCGERATCSTDHLGHVCTCQSASAGTCMTPEETIAANDKYHVCDCKI